MVDLIEKHVNVCLAGWKAGKRNKHGMLLPKPSTTKMGEREFEKINGMLGKVKLDDDNNKDEADTNIENAHAAFGKDKLENDKKENREKENCKENI